MGGLFCEIQNIQSVIEITQQTLDIVKKAVVKCLEYEDINLNEVEVSIVFVDDKHISELNSKYRKINCPTDVLSFPMDDFCILQGEPTLLGDIVISLETVKRIAPAPKEFLNYLMLLVVHGLLHLLGYDHVDDEDAEIMENLETRILETLI